MDQARGTALERALAGYGRQWPQEAAVAGQFLELLSDPHDPFLRQRLAGHFTGSAWVVSADGARTLLTHHRKLDRWLQPGGHADGDVDLAGVALREAQEETGVAGLRLEDGAIFDLDRHWIPMRGQVPAQPVVGSADASSRREPPSRLQISSTVTASRVAAGA